MGNGEFAVTVPEKSDIAHPEHGTGGPLFGLPDPGDITTWHRWVSAAGVTVGDDAVRDRNTFINPTGDGSGSSKIHIIRVGGNDQDPLHGVFLEHDSP